MQTGTFQECLKIGIVRAVHKKGSKKELNNYQPTVSGKVLEKVILKRLLNSLFTNDVINPHQHGFQSGQSTITAAIDFINE